MTQPQPPPLSYLTPDVRGFEDRSTMLKVVGIFLIIGGGLSGCIAGAMPLAALAPSPPGGPGKPNTAEIVGAFLLYAAVAVGLIALGIGSLRRRRWVRPIVLSLAWIGVVGGTFALIGWILIAPDMGAALRPAHPPGTPAIPPAAITMIVIVMTFMMVLFYLVIPGVLVWLFKGADVQSTLEFYDPTVRWTDAVPLPVFTLFTLLVLAGVWALMMLPQGWYAGFGIALTGTTARMAMIINAALFLAAAWLVYRLQPAGWMLALALFILVPLAWVVTILRVDLAPLYASMGMPAEQVEVVAAMKALNPAMMSIFFALMTLAAVAFTIRIRRFFFATTPQPQP